MYKKLAVGISICSGATATIIPLVLMWLGYKTPLKLVLWLYLLLISISLVFCLASLCYVKKDKQAAILFMEDRMKVKDYEVKGSSAKEVLEGIMEEHTNAKVSRISEGLYNVHLELEEEQPASYVPKGWSIRRRAGANMYACVYKRGSLVYKLYQNIDRR